MIPNHRRPPRRFGADDDLRIVALAQYYGSVVRDDTNFHYLAWLMRRRRWQAGDPPLPAPIYHEPSIIYA